MSSRLSCFALLCLVTANGSPCRAQKRLEAPAAHPAIPILEKLIQHEVADKKLPALSIALVDDQTVIWAQGFGQEDPKTRKQATHQTVYRVGRPVRLNRGKLIEPLFTGAG